eukprot:1791750-Prymnesium_polylepis.2
MNPPGRALASSTCAVDGSGHARSVVYVSGGPTPKPSSCCSGTLPTRGLAAEGSVTTNMLLAVTEFTHTVPPSRLACT